MIQDPVAIVATLFVVIALLFAAERHAVLGKLFRFVPLIVFAYFVPTLLSNVGVLPLDSPAYGFVKKTLLPASLLLLTLSVDLPTIARLGKPSVLLFLAGTASIFLGSLVAYGTVGWLIPPAMHADAWKGLAALCGSWIGGGANFVAVGESVQTPSTMMGVMVIVDVAVASVWMACLLFFAGRERELDEKIGARREAIDEVRAKVERFQREVSRPTSLRDLTFIVALSLGGTVACSAIAKHLPDVGTIINGFTWVVILVTALGVALSFTPLRKLEGAGASAVGSLFLYVLIATIGAQGEFRAIVNAPVLVLVGAVWMTIHAVVMLLVRRALKAPMFFLAVGSQANVGAAASAPVVASAFHPALAPVGVLLAIFGYVLGTYLALLNAWLLERMYLALFAG
jgi:uncharacterized membrane protein